MKKLEIIIPFNCDVSITIDNCLIGYSHDYETYRKFFKFPLPEGNWIILDEYREKIILGDIS